MGPHEDGNNRINYRSSWGNNIPWWLKPSMEDSYITFNPYTELYTSAIAPNMSYDESISKSMKLLAEQLEQFSDLDPGDTRPLDEFLNEFCKNREKGIDT